jgi:hypothetical protein
VKHNSDALKQVVLISIGTNLRLNLDRMWSKLLSFLDKLVGLLGTNAHEFVSDTECDSIEPNLDNLENNYLNKLFEFFIIFSQNYMYKLMQILHIMSRSLNAPTSF